jgi:hypothetical protein
MIDRMYCQEQLLRFSGLPGYPKTDEGRRSLIDAMQGAFSFAGQEALRRWVEDSLRGRDRCPLPRDAYQSGRDATPSSPAPAIKCFVCYDTGQSSAEFLVTTRHGRRTAQRLTGEQAANLWNRHREAQRRGDRAGMFAVDLQMIYEYTVPCECQAKQLRLPGSP